MPEDFLNNLDPEPVDGHYELTFEEHPGYLFACVEGEALTSKSINEYQTTIVAEIVKQGADRVMIKRDVSIRDSSAALCGIVYLVKALRMKDLKFAFVDVNPLHLPSYKLALLFARSSGIEAEVFGDIPSAREWLLG